MNNDPPVVVPFSEDSDRGVTCIGRRQATIELKPFSPIASKAIEDGISGL